MAITSESSNVEVLEATVSVKSGRKKLYDNQVELRLSTMLDQIHSGLS